MLIVRDIVIFKCLQNPIRFNLFIFFLTFKTSGLRIHISEATKSILEMLGGFVIHERGDVFLKV